MTETHGEISCSAHSMQVDEPLFATATPTRVYLLLEYAGPWGAKAFKESDLPEEVKRALNAYVKSDSSAKLLLVKRPRRAARDKLHFFIAVVDETEPALYAFQLSHYGYAQELLALDIPAIVSGAPQYSAHRQEGPLILVCTNGRRDLCCARSGVPVYKALNAEAGEEPQVWESSHLGGHRFAPNVLCLPHGLLYGRLRPEDAPAIIEACRARRVHLPNLRGRTCYPEAVQAAEHFLRQQTGQPGLDAFRLQAGSETQPGNWLIRFIDRPGHTVHQLQVALQVSQTPVYESCQLDKTTLVKRYHLVTYASSAAGALDS